MLRFTYSEMVDFLKKHKYEVKEVHVKMVDVFSQPTKIINKPVYGVFNDLGREICRPSRDPYQPFERHEWLNAAFYTVLSKRLLEL